MKDKFSEIYGLVMSNMRKLDEKQIDIEHAKAMASLAKQANNVIVTQLSAAKFITNANDSQKALEDVGL